MRGLSCEIYIRMKVHRYLFVLLLWANCFFISAQLILPTLTGSFDQYPNFNRVWIKKFKIKNITFDILDKKDDHPGKDQGLVHHFDFDTSGHLSRFYYTRIIRETIREVQVPASGKGKRRKRAYTSREIKYEYDTVSIRFFYDNTARLKLKRFNDGNYYESTYWDYDSSGRVLRELRCKETNLHPDKTQFTLGVQNIISDERFEYIPTGKLQYKKKCLNDEGLPFKEVIVNFNESNQPTEQNENFIVTWISQKTKFQYDKFGQMAEKTFETNTDGALALRDTFEYDNKGNITWERQYKNQILLNERSYLFDNTNDIVTSFVIRDHIQKSMRITKLMYEYYK